MNTLTPMGLVASGRMTDSTLRYVPQLGPAIGPVVAASKRLASRYANTLRMGRAADGVEALAPCPLVWIQAPAQGLGPVLEELARAPLDWEAKIVVLLEAELDSAFLAPLARLGACVATVTHAPLRQSTFLVAEGDVAALRALRLVWKSAGQRVVELRPGLKPAYSAGLMAAQSLAAAVAQTSLDALRLAGVDQNSAKRLTAAMVDAAIREQLTHGRRAWVSPAAEGRREATARQMRALDEANPELAACLTALLKATLAWNREPAEWLEQRRPARAGGRV